MQDFEKLGVFYLGRKYDLDARKTCDDLLLYDAKDLTTHAVCVGMTGSGKTGLCLALLEEAAIDGIPAIAIDPKGDIGNLMLTFPQLQAADFRPWLDPAEATRKGVTADEQAQQTADRWRSGLAEWGQDAARIARLRDAADVAIYTPGSQAGLPISLLRSFSAPPKAVLDSADALRERINGSVSGLLSLLGVDADPLRSREHILLSNLLDRAWRQGRDLDMGALIREIQTPPLEKIGVMDLESFFPAKDRFALSMSLNNLLASPGFSAWMEGEPLDIGRLLHTPQGKPRISILSIAHLSDAERMFFVTILLNEIVAWMRSQSGTSSLRALLYMDEVFGFFPPTANPPTKTPMLTLLKQARAYGLGVVLATQNPVDLDYKGLSNAGTWFLGRLQTERDKARVLEGLEGASAAAGSSFDRARMGEILAGLGNRVFVMNNVHEDEPVVFQTRWALSFLRGPLSRDQIQTLMQPRKQSPPTAAAATSPLPTSAAAAPPPAAASAAPVPGLGDRPLLPPGVTELFMACRAAPRAGQTLLYRPAVLGSAKIHFTQASTGIDAWETVTLLASTSDTDSIWNDAQSLADGAPDLEKQPASAAAFASLPAELSRPKRYPELATSLKDHVYRHRTLKLWKSALVKQISQPGESEGEFRARLSHTARELRDGQLEKLRGKYAPKLAALQEQIRKAQQRVEKEKQQASQQTLQTAISVGTSILGALFGRKLASSANITRAGTSMRSASRTAKERADIEQANETVEALQERLSLLETELQLELDTVKSTVDADRLELTEVEIKPKKGDISVEQTVLAWTPWLVDDRGLSEPAFG